MADQKPKVTLGYSKSKKEYLVEQIEGSRTTVPFGRGDDANLARIGRWFSEADTDSLGQEADLVVRAYRLDA